jgi:hypothetical protein
MTQTVRISGTPRVGRSARAGGAEVNYRSTLMSGKIRFPAIALSVGWLGFLLPLFTLLNCASAWGACNYQDIDITKCSKGNGQNNLIYDNPGGQGFLATDKIALCPASPTVTWALSGFHNCTVDGTGLKATCADPGIPADIMTITATNGSTVNLGGQNPSGKVTFGVMATDSSIPDGSCTNSYVFDSTGNTGGWGDPHIFTVDDVHYDFQGAGEFIALRGDGQGGGESTAPRGGGLEIQTRQTGIATTFLPGANPYTGLQTCVALYSAVAARVGKHRVSYEPNLSGVPDPSGLQLRVDGVLTTLGPQGIDLDGSRVVQPWGGNGIEIDYSDKTILIVTPAFWSDQQKWYLNVNVYGATATKGIFGKLAEGPPPYNPASWLPALPDGTSLGPKPDSLHQRYLDLYGKFADAWRVTDATSLFDYAPGTSTATFTDRGWPRENPKSCAIEGQPSAGPAIDVGVAEKQCSAITDNNMRADCVFDVSVTGFTGFANTYVLTQQRRPDATETTVKGDRDFTTYGENATFTATVAQITPRGGSTPIGTAQFILDGGNVGNPVTLDANGRALWSSSGLQVGQHQIVAQYTPTGWGPFMASTSPQVSHTVIAAGYLYFWIIIVLLIITLILIAFLIWRSLRGT